MALDMIATLISIIVGVIITAPVACAYDVKSKGIRIPYCGGCRPRNKKCLFSKKMRVTIE